jgi:ketosteroid isomerase-like protein
MMSREDSGKSLQAVRDRVARAVVAMMNGDSGPWLEIYSHAADATLFGGWGGHEKGWEELSRRWEMVRGRYRSGTMRLETLGEHVDRALAVTVELLRGEATFSDGSQGPIGLRITHVYRLEDAGWRIVHWHADPQLEVLPIKSHLQPR